jgi:hypothetical protein
MAKKKPRRTAAEVVELWRPSPGFIGPSMPPMVAWQRAGEPGWPFNRPEWISEARWAGIEGRAPPGEQLELFA